MPVLYSCAGGRRRGACDEPARLGLRRTRLRRHFRLRSRRRGESGYLDPRVRLVELPKGHFASTRALAALLRQERPDVALSGIGVSNLKLFVAAAAAGRLNRAAQSLHGYFHSEPQLLSRLGALMLPATSRLFARTVTVSDGLDAYARRRFKVSAQRTRRIYNPVLARAAEPISAATLAQRAPNVLASGRSPPTRIFRCSCAPSRM
ncbi:MAG: glycosyltransferase [Rhodoblastus sp.]|nr:MAG: glycosyltransferase [Rhodoblastus sp.]